MQVVLSKMGRAEKRTGEPWALAKKKREKHGEKWKKAWTPTVFLSLHAGLLC